MDIKHKQLYVAYDKYTRMYKIGSSSNVNRRVAQLSSWVKRPLELIFSTPGHDYFLKEIPIARATHPVWHGGENEWYHDTPEFQSLLEWIMNKYSMLDLSGIATEGLHKYTEEASR